MLKCYTYQLFPSRKFDSLDVSYLQVVVFHFFFSSHGEACCTLWKRGDHITPVLASLHWLPIHCRIHFKILLFVFKILSGLAPQYLAELLQVHNPVRALRSSSELLFEVPRSRLKTKGDQAFSVAAPKLWNNLLLHVRHEINVTLTLTYPKVQILGYKCTGSWKHSLSFH